MKISKSLPFLLFLVIPILYFINGTLQFNIKTFKFIDALDPEYAYIYNGFILSHLQFALGHVDHPGTPVQMILAISFRVYYMFSNAQLDFAHHFVQNTESYMFFGHKFLLLFNGIVLLVVGYFAHKILNNIIFGLFIQFTPFIDYMSFTVSGRIVPETLAVSSLMLIVILLRFIYDNNRNEKKYYTWLFAIICGFLISIKITYIPFLVLPFLLLKGFKKKIVFTLVSISSAFIFALPVLFRFNHFKRWVINLFNHSGVYGSGPEGFIETNAIIPRLLEFIKWYPVFFISLLLLIIICCIESIRNYKSKTPVNYKVKVLMTVFVAIIFQVFISIKHFGYHYILPSTHFTLLIIVIITLIMMEWKIPKFRLIYLAIYGLLTIYFMGNLLNYYKTSAVKIKEKFRGKLETYQKVEELREMNYTHIIIPDYYGSPFIEYAHFFGAVSAWKHNTGACTAIKEFFPASFIFLPHVPQLYSSCYEAKFNELPANKDILIYSSKDQPDVISLITDSIKNVLNINEDIVPNMIYLNQKTGEQMFILDLNN